MQSVHEDGTRERAGKGGSRCELGGLLAYIGRVEITRKVSRKNLCTREPRSGAAELSKTLAC